MKIPTPARVLFAWLISGILFVPGITEPSLCHGADTDVAPVVSPPQPDSAEEHLLLGIDFFLTDELEVAMDEFREAARQRPGYAEAHHNLGVALAKSGNLHGAIAAWSQAERLNVQTGVQRYHLSAVISYNYGISFVRDGQVEQAMKQWETALRIQPDFSEARYAIGLGWLAEGQPAQAIEHFQKTLGQVSDWPAVYEAMGLAFYAMQNYALAEQTWREALTVRSDLPKVHVYLGLLRLNEGSYREAIEQFRQALDLQPELVEAHYNLGVAFLVTGKEADSAELLKKAISFNPRLTSARLLLGVAWSRLSQWGQAAAIWREALFQDTTSQEEVWLHHNLGIAMMAMGNIDEAVQEFRVVAGLRPDWAPGWAQLGSSLMAARQWDKAVDALESAVRLEPLWSHLHFSLGKVRVEQGKLPQAIIAFQRAVELDPQFIDAWYHLGLVHRTQNRTRDAVETLRLAAEGGIREAQSLLASMYANGSGTERNLSLAMLWWFRSSRSFVVTDAARMARDQLSQLRRAFHGHLLSAADRQQVSTGFNLIREDLHRHAPFHKRNHSTVNQDIDLHHMTPIKPVLSWVIEQALALNQSAQHQLHSWYTYDENDRSAEVQKNIRQYFLQTAQEGDPFSCQVVKNFATEGPDLPTFEWRQAGTLCPEQAAKPAF